MNDVTIIYYTSNKEEYKFEEKIRQNILKFSGNLPIISISQKPIDFGKNICVGEKDNNYWCEFKQIQIGLREAQSKWVLTAESDVLLPPEYFSFIPSDNYICYRYSPVWINFMDRRPDIFYLKGTSDGIKIIDRVKWLERIDNIVGKEENWNQPKGFTTEKLLLKNYKFWTGSPAISFKTRRGVSYMTGLKNGVKSDILPYWGKVKQIRENYL